AAHGLELQELAADLAVERLGVDPVVEAELCAIDGAEALELLVELGDVRLDARLRAVLDLPVELVEAVADRGGRRVAAVGFDVLVDQAGEGLVGGGRRLPGARRRAARGHGRGAAAGEEEEGEERRSDHGAKPSNLRGVAGGPRLSFAHWRSVDRILER